MCVVVVRACVGGGGRDCRLAQRLTTHAMDSWVEGTRPAIAPCPAMACAHHTRGSTRWRHAAFLSFDQRS